MARRARVPWGALVTLVILATFAIGAWMLFGTGIRVPSVVKLDRSDAEKTIEAAGLLVGNVTEEESSEAAPGTVLSQVPKPGVRTNEGATVDIVVAKLKLEYQAFAPGVTGFGQPESVSAIQASGLSAETYFSYSDAIDAGTVLEQYPAAGEGVLPDAPLAMAVSLGPVEERAAVAVPDLVTKRGPAAKSELEGIKLNSHSVIVASQKAVGEVVAQLPSPQSQVPPGAAVAIFISGGPTIVPQEEGRVRIPGILNQQQVTAVQALQNAGLQVAIFPTFSSEVPAGDVAGQFPQSGMSVKAGSTVLVAVSEGPPSGEGVVVPDATGVTGASISSVFSNAGLYAIVFEMDVRGGAGQVVQQFPQAGAIVSPGARVGLAVVASPRIEAPETTVTPPAP
jgi:beta-lactam-binding protein with PASTA domain